VLIEVGILNGVSYILLSSLSRALQQRFSSIRLILGQGLGAAFHSIHLNLNMYLKAKSELYEALALLFVGIDKKDNSSPGEGLGYMRWSCKVLDGISHLTDLPTILQAVNSWKKLAHDECAGLTKDNETIYFALVPDNETLRQALPEPKFNVSAITYHPPPLLSVSFFSHS